MEKDEEFLHTFFTYLSQLCFDKAKEHVEKEKDLCRNVCGPWIPLLTQLLHVVLVEKSYNDLGFLANKNKSFLRKDNSLKAVFDTLKTDLKRIEDGCKQTVADRRVATYCQNVFQYVTARIDLIDFYEKVHQAGTLKSLKYNELLNHIQAIVQKHIHSFTDATLTNIKTIFTLECKILEELFKSLIEIQKLQFLPSLALVYGVHSSLSMWENKMQYRETWKLGIFKNNPLPPLFQWLQKFKAAVLSKFSLYFYETLSKQTTTNEMRQLCSKLQHDYYHKIAAFQKKYDSSAILIMSENQNNFDMIVHDNYPIIVSYPKNLTSNDTFVQLLRENSAELNVYDKIVYKYNVQAQSTYIVTTIESNMYLLIIFESKKSEKDTFIANFVQEFCLNLRCLKIFVGLKNQSK